MKQYFKSLDKEYYKYLIRKELSEDIIDHLHMNTRKIYISDIDTKYDKKSNTLTNIVTIYKRGYLGVYNTKVCQIRGIQRFNYWKIHSGNNIVKETMLYETEKLQFRLFNENILSKSALEDIVVSLDYNQIISKAEEKKKKSRTEKIFKIFN